MKSSLSPLNLDLSSIKSSTSPSLLSAKASPNGAFFGSIVMNNKNFINNSSLSPLKAPKSYGTYSKQQQEQVIAFIRDGNSLRTAEKLFGIPKSTMHCWLKKLNQDGSPSPSMVDNQPKNEEDAKFSMDGEKPLATSEKVSPRLPPVKPGGRGNRTPSPPPPTVKDKPRTQIIIEEAELIRFLQTDEGADLISKAYGISVGDFKRFVLESKSNSSLRGVLVTPGKQQKVEVLGLVRNAEQAFPAEKVNRKRVFSCSSQSLASKKHHVNFKKVKSEPEESPLTSLLKVANEKRCELLAPSSHSELGLTPQQLIVASKLINEVGVDSVSTYLTTKPVVLTSNQAGISNNLYSPNILDQKPVIASLQETAELSPTYPRIVNPVSVKAEFNDLGHFVTPADVSSPSPNRIEPTDVKPVTQIPIQMSFTRPTSSINTNVKLNLNEINRTQSEKDLMALVDEDAVSADELCADFNETLELSSWVDNETWYTDQYLQHFQVSPATSNKLSDTIVPPQAIENPSTPTNSVSDDDVGLTFSFNKKSSVDNKSGIESKKMQYLTVPQLIHGRHVSVSPPLRTNEEKTSKHNKFESAFYRPVNKTKEEKTINQHRSAFSKSLS